MFGLALSPSLEPRHGCLVSVPEQGVQGARPGRAPVLQPRGRWDRDGSRRLPDPRRLRVRVWRHFPGQTQGPFVCGVVSYRGGVRGAEERITGASCPLPSTSVGDLGSLRPQAVLGQRRDGRWQLVGWATGVEFQSPYRPRGPVWGLELGTAEAEKTSGNQPLLL